jgi:hypothetical protein
MRNPHEFIGYDENVWGLTACDGPSDELLNIANKRRLFGYAARGVPYGPDDGTLSAPCVVASVPFAPELVLPAMRNLIARYPEAFSEGRFASGFNPTLSDANEHARVSAGHYGLDQGIVIMMIENHFYVGGRRRGNMLKWKWRN